MVIDHWWHRDVIAAGKLPLLLCFLAFVLTFAITRTITRLIRSGRGPFSDRVTADGLHVHHSIPGLILLIVGAFLSVGASRHGPWGTLSGLLVGVGTSLVLDEFALLLRLKDDYWTADGAISVELVSLTAACLAFALVGFSPVGVRDVGGTELAVRVGAIGVLVLHSLVELGVVLKGKYTTALIGLFVPLVGLVAVSRLARPGSVWFRHLYGEERSARAVRRTESFDRRWDPMARRWTNLVGGRPTG